MSLMPTRLATLLLLAALISGCSKEPVLVQLEDITVTSDAFANNEAIPEVHTCDGADEPPPLTWGPLPDGVREVVLLAVDRNADGFVHWMVSGLDPQAGSVEGGVQGLNDFGNVGYGGPCPPPGEDPHEYVFNIYGLTRGSGLGEGFTQEQLDDKLQNANSAGQLVGTYQRK